MSKTYTPTQELLNLPLDERIRWAEALESGEYKQCQGQMADGERGFCCLGVWENINGMSVEDMEDGHGGYIELPIIAKNFHTIDGKLPEDVRFAACSRCEITPYDLNDSNDFNFHDIAQILRGNEVVK